MSNQYGYLVDEFSGHILIYDTSEETRRQAGGVYRASDAIVLGSIKTTNAAALIVEALNEHEQRRIDAGTAREGCGVSFSGVACSLPEGHMAPHEYRDVTVDVLRPR